MALIGGRGVIIPFRDTKTLSRELVTLLGDKARVAQIGKAAMTFMADKSWDSVGRQYLDLFDRLRTCH